ncbi:MAG TPA: MarR family transcriptional regulator [Myxococcales bacterium]|nr:MarR family transcriptional regulator [Myxococcales bacterium]
MVAPALDGGVLEFLRLLWAVDHGLHQHSKRMSEKLGVTGVQRFVIRMIGRRGSLTPGELAEDLHLHPSTLTGVIRRLEQAGFIAMAVDPLDHRRRRLALTRRGRRIDGTRQGTVERQIELALARLEPDELAAARRALAALGQQLADGT